jgi:hypothetical protein
MLLEPVLTSFAGQSRITRKQLCALVCETEPRMPLEQLSGLASEPPDQLSLLVRHPGCRVVRICTCGNCRRCCRLTTLDYLRRQWTGRAASGRRRDRLRSRRSRRHNDPGDPLARSNGGMTARGTTRRGRDPDEGRRHDREGCKASSYFHNVSNLVSGNPRGQSRRLSNFFAFEISQHRIAGYPPVGSA